MPPDYRTGLTGPLVRERPFVFFGPTAGRTRGMGQHGKRRYKAPMTQDTFLARLGLALGAALLLAALLRLGLGPRWFQFYGWATVALATVLPVSALLWTRLPAIGLSRWWSLAVAVPVLLAATVQIGFWVLFFAEGPRNPSFGVGREMVRPWLEMSEPFLLAAYGALCAWLLWRAGVGRAASA